MSWTRELCMIFCYSELISSAESGTHDELYARKGQYFEMVQAQALERTD